MHSHRISGPRFVALAGIACFVTACCAPESARNAAASGVRCLEESALQRDKAYHDQLRRMAQVYFESWADQQRAQLAAKRAELSLEVWRRADAKRTEVASTIERQLEDALKPSVDRMHNELEQQKAKRDDSRAGQEKETLLRAQLAATLALAQRENAKAQDELQQKIASARDDVVRSIPDQLPDSLVVIDPAAEAKAAVDAWIAQGTDTYPANVSALARELERFVMLDSPLTLAFRGLASSFGGSIGSLLTSTTDKLVGKLQQKVDSVATRLRTDIDAKLATGGK